MARTHKAPQGALRLLTAHESVSDAGFSRGDPDVHSDAGERRGDGPAGEQPLPMDDTPLERVPITRVSWQATRLSRSVPRPLASFPASRGAFFVPPFGG